MAGSDGEHIFAPFDEALNGFRALNQTMGKQVVNQLERASESLLTGDVGLARQVLHRENRINQFSMEADEMAVNLLAVHHPLATDLRLILCLASVANNLEEIGDEAKKIAHITIKTFDQHNDFTQHTIFSDVRRLCEAAGRQLRGGLRALHDEDVTAAVSVIQDEERLNLLFSGSLRRLASFLLEDPRNISAELDALLALKSLERAGGHASSIAKSLIFAVKGKDVRYIQAGHLSEGYLDG